MTDPVINIDIPDDVAVVFANGRVFADMSHVVATLDDRISGREFASNIMADDEFTSQVAGQRYLLTEIAAMSEIASLTASIED